MDVTGVDLYTAGKPAGPLYKPSLPSLIQYTQYRLIPTPGEGHCFQTSLHIPLYRVAIACNFVTSQFWIKRDQSALQACCEQTARKSIYTDRQPQKQPDSLLTGQGWPGTTPSPLLIVHFSRKCEGGPVASQHKHATAACRTRTTKGLSHTFV
ncbi:hypothetical protein V2G26_011665 [Clonostachys chloroleuca]